MSFDTTTETIAHFIGIFHLATEEARLRADYTEFKALEAKQDDAVEYSFRPVQVDAQLDSHTYDPKTKYVINQDANAPASGSALSVASSQPGPYGGPGFGLFGPPQEMPGNGSTTARFEATVLPYVPIPSSVITLTLQSITLFDDDILGNGALANFVSPEGFHDALYQVIGLAEALQPWSFSELVEDVLDDPVTAALALRDVLEDVAAPEIEGLSATIRTDEDVNGIHVNGEVVDEALVLEDQLPVFISAKRDMLDDKDDADADLLAGHTKNPWSALAEEGQNLSTMMGSDHSVSTGANESHNHVDIQTSWIDAGVIAVSGDVIKLDAISQINILSDKDHYQGHSWSDLSSPSQAYNIASMIVGYRTEQADGADEVSAVPLSFPSTWNLERIEGDVTATNFLNQFTFGTDNDRLELTFTASKTSIVTGENQTYNVAHAGEFGFGYDLILVGGSMVSMNVVNQTNVLLDGDHFSGEGLESAIISGGDNLLRNEARIEKEGKDTQVEMAKEFKDALRDLNEGAKDLAKAVAQNEMFEGLDTVRALYIEGDLIQMNVVDQINYLGDQDQVHMAKDAMVSAIKDSPVTITSGSNLLTNTASILETGYDSDVMTDGEYYSEALLYQAELIDTDANPNGVNMSALTNEAVAFLAEEMVADALADALENAGLQHDALTGGATSDVMQSMTA